MGQARDGMFSNLDNSVFAKAIIWLVVVGLSLPTPAYSACGCSNSTDGCCCQKTRCGGQMPHGERYCCCCRHESPKSTSCCCCHHDTKPKANCCCSTTTQTAEKLNSPCTCGPNCMCGKNQAPTPPAVPPTHDPDPVVQLALVQLATLNVCCGADETLQRAASPQTELFVATTSLGRCIDLCRLTL